jgi:RNA polymerase sigma factor (sigma-70 family)
MKVEDELIPTRSSLLTRLKDWGDQAGWERFVDTYSGLLYGTARKAGLTEADAQDVVQETLLEVARKMKGFKYDPARGSFKGWLLNVVRWRVLDRQRKQHRDRAQPSPRSDDSSGTDPIHRLADPAAPAFDAIYEEQWQKSIYEAARDEVKKNASARQYQLFDLYVTQALPIEEIIETLGVSANQVYQAKRRVSKLIDKEVRKVKEFRETRFF